jgi:hypothetical protein
LPKKIDDRAAIYLMVEQLDSNPSLKIRRVAREAARQLGLPGKPSAHEERLRKKYYRLLEAGDLAVQSRSARLDVEIERVFAAQEAAVAQSRERLATKEQEAISRGSPASRSAPSSGCSSRWAKGASGCCRSW